MIRQYEGHFRTVKNRPQVFQWKILCIEHNAAQALKRQGMTNLPFVAICLREANMKQWRRAVKYLHLNRTYLPFSLGTWGGRGPGGTLIKGKDNTQTVWLKLFQIKALFQVCGH